MSKLNIIHLITCFVKFGKILLLEHICCDNPCTLQSISKIIRWVTLLNFPDSCIWLNLYFGNEKDLWFHNPSLLSASLVIANYKNINGQIKNFRTKYKSLNLLQQLPKENQRCFYFQNEIFCKWKFKCVRYSRPMLAAVVKFVFIRTCVF